MIDQDSNEETLIREISQLEQRLEDARAQLDSRSTKSHITNEQQLPSPCNVTFTHLPHRSRLKLTSRYSNCSLLDLTVNPPPSPPPLRLRPPLRFFCLLLRPRILPRPPPARRTRVHIHILICTILSSFPLPFPRLHRMHNATLPPLGTHNTICVTGPR